MSLLNFPLLSSGSMQGFLRPPVSSNAMAMYPVDYGLRVKTRVVTFLDDEEQRWVSMIPLFSAVLQFHGVNGYDMSIIRAFFNEMDGRYITDDLLHTFNFTFDGTTYENCGFDQDMLETEENRGGTYSFELRILQIAPNGSLG